MAAPLEPETTPEEYRQRAMLLADLGRYDEAAGEIAAGLAEAPDEPSLLATLARIHLAAEQPTEALVAAQRASAAAPEGLNAQVVLAMALTDSQRYTDAARVAADILRRWPADAYAQRTGAALLSESRNGQQALNAAWNGVRVAPAEPEAHLILAVVAARLRLFDLAQRAYAEALDLDPTLGDADGDVGIVRFERRRWAIALEELADEAIPPEAAAPVDPDRADRDRADQDRADQDRADRDRADLDRADQDGPYPTPFPRPYSPPDRPLPDDPPGHSSTAWTGSPAVSRPSGPVLDPSDDTVEAVRRAVVYGASWTLVAAVVTASMALVSVGISRTWAALIGVCVLGGITFWLNRQLTESLAAGLARLRATRRSLAVAAYLTFVAPVFLLVYTVVGNVVPLVTGMVVAAVAELIVLTKRQ